LLALSVTKFMLLLLLLLEDQHTLLMLLQIQVGTL
jgi:hypothetical protein